MVISIKIPNKLRTKHEIEFRDFLQLMSNRRAVGNLRYGEPNAQQEYLTRLEKELKAYKKTRNKEHLVNIANYCFLESMCPEVVFDPTVASVTRKIKDASSTGD